MITVQINGASIAFTDNISITDALEKQGLDVHKPGFAVALNYAVVPRSQWTTAVLKNNDQVDVVHAIAGG